VGEDTYDDMPGALKFLIESLLDELRKVLEISFLSLDHQF
jgi:hypothetical protein